jgi:hypothetical protein
MIGARIAHADLHGPATGADGRMGDVECLHVNTRSASGFAVWTGSGHLPYVTDADRRGGRTCRRRRALTDER